MSMKSAVIQWEKGCHIFQWDIMGKPEFMGHDLIQWEITRKPEFTGYNLIQWEISGKHEFTGCDLIQWGIMGKYMYHLGFTGAVQFRDGCHCEIS